MSGLFDQGFNRCFNSHLIYMFLCLDVAIIPHTTCNPPSPRLFSWDSVRRTTKINSGNRRFKSLAFIPLLRFYSEQEFRRLTIVDRQFYLILVFCSKSLIYIQGASNMNAHVTKPFFLLPIAEDSGTLGNYFT